MGIDNKMISDEQNERLLEEMQYFVTDYIDMECLKTMNFEIEYVPIYVAAMQTLKLTIKGERVSRPIVTHPETWKDAFLERWTPDWLRKYVTIKYTVHEPFTNIVYPTIKVPGHKGYQLNSMSKKSVDKL